MLQIFPRWVPVLSLSVLYRKVPIVRYANGPDGFSCQPCARHLSESYYDTLIGPYTRRAEYKANFNKGLSIGLGRSISADGRISAETSLAVFSWGMLIGVFLILE